MTMDNLIGEEETDVFWSHHQIQRKLYWLFNSLEGKGKRKEDWNDFGTCHNVWQITG